MCQQYTALFPRISQEHLNLAVSQVCWWFFVLSFSKVNVTFLSSVVDDIFSRLVRLSLFRTGGSEKISQDAVSALWRVYKSTDFLLKKNVKQVCLALMSSLKDFQTNCQATVTGTGTWDLGPVGLENRKYPQSQEMTVKCPGQPPPPTHP